VPKLGRDDYVVYPNARHVVVVSRNQFYSVNVLNEDQRPYQENQIRTALQHISQRSPSSLASYSHPPCGVLTTGSYLNVYYVCRCLCVCVTV
jgi:Choline/Carnitine o-acyltransferase